MRFFFRIFFSFVLFIIFSNFLMAATTLKLIDGEISKKDDLIFYTNAHLFAQTDNQLWELKATTITYNSNLNVLILENNVFIKNEQIEITGKKMIFDLESGLFRIEDGIIYDFQNFIQVKAKKLEQIESDIFELEKAFFSSCFTKENKTWEFFVNQVTYRVGNFAYGTNALFYLESIPILYMPVFSWPTVEDRRSGLLPPIISYKNSPTEREYGLRVEIPYFFNLGNRTDYVLGIDYLQTRGVAFNNEFLYFNDAKQAANIRFWYLDESFQARETSTDTVKHQQRYLLDLFHRIKIGTSSEFFLESFRQSDSEVKEDYFRQEILSEDSKTFRNDRASFRYNWGSGDLIFSAKEERVFSEEDAYPRINKALNPTAVDWVAVDFTQTSTESFFQNKITSQWKNFSTKNGWQGIRSISSLELKVSLSNSYFYFSPSVKNQLVSYQVDYATSDQEIVSGSLTRDFDYFYLNFNLKTGLDFDKKTTEGEWLFQIKLNYESIPDFDQRESLARLQEPDQNYLDYFNDDLSAAEYLFDKDDQTLAKNALEIIFFWNFNKNKESESVFTVELATIYDFIAVSTTEDLEQQGPIVLPQNRENALSLEQNWLPTHLDLNWKPANWTQVNYFTRYDSVAGSDLEHKIELQIQTENNSFKVTSHKNFFGSTNLDNIDYFKKDELVYTVNSKVLADWDLFLDLKKNYLLPLKNSDLSSYFLNDDLDEVELGFSYTDCCTEIDFSFYERADFNEITQNYVLDRGIKLNFQIKGGY